MIIENYLDWYDILINEIAGEAWIFILIGLIAILYICAYTRIPFQASVMLAFLFLAVMASAMSSLPIWAFVVFASGLGFYYMIGRRFSKG